MNIFHQRPSGFTIIELLIVIIVIAILAVITLASYGGIQRQAGNAQTATAIRQYKQALTLYAEEKGEYPRLNSATGGWGPNCIGDQYSDSSNMCWTGTTPINTYFNNQLKPYFNGQLPMPAKGPFLYGGLDYRGAIFYYNPAALLDGSSPAPFVIAYYLWGSAQKCPVGPVLNVVWPNFFSNNTTGYTAHSGGITICYIKLPQPNTP